MCTAAAILFCFVLTCQEKKVISQLFSNFKYCVEFKYHLFSAKSLVFYRVIKKHKGGGTPTGIGKIKFTLEQATRSQRL
jgi:multisubunit Na+/H+ antiporter MnhE subunit